MPVPSQEYDSWYPFDWCVWAFDFAIYKLMIWIFLGVRDFFYFNLLFTSLHVHEKWYLVQHAYLKNYNAHESPTRSGTFLRVQYFCNFTFYRCSSLWNRPREDNSQQEKQSPVMNVSPCIRSHTNKERKTKHEKHWIG